MDVFHRLTQQTLTHPEKRIYDQTDYQYDGIDQLIKRQSQTQQEESGLTQAKQEAFEYNAIGQLVKESVAYTQDHQVNSRAQGTKRKHTEFEWDSVGNPIAQRTVIESDEPKTQIDETVETAETEENEQTIRAITEGDRLLSFADTDYRYDDCGNQIRELGIGIKTQRGFNAFNQFTSFSKGGVLTQL